MNQQQHEPGPAEQESSCARCKGLMVPSYAEAVVREQANRLPASAWRCVNCGDWVDATIIKNRERAGDSDVSSITRLRLPKRRRWRW